MSKIQRCQLSDEELKQRGIEIPADITDKSFFDEIEQMIQEEFSDIPDEKQ